MARMWGPPPRCAACGRFGSTATEVEGATVCACGGALPARPFVDPSAPASPPVPEVCGTAQLAMARIDRLRALGDRARISVRLAGSELAVRIDLGDADARPVPPTHLGVLVVPAGAAFSGGTDATIELGDGSTYECLVPGRAARPADVVTVVLRLADALYERVVTVAS